MLHETSPQSVYMVGDSAESDVKGVLDAHLQAILYSPMSRARQAVLFGEEIPVITHMDQLLDHLPYAEGGSSFNFYSRWDLLSLKAWESTWLQSIGIACRSQRTLWSLSLKPWVSFY